jgi:hypothetical protein
MGFLRSKTNAFVGFADSKILEPEMPSGTILSMHSLILKIHT